MDIYEEVTRRIVEQMEQGEFPWRKPWIAGGSCVSYATGKPYSLLNQMLLGQPGEYLTFRQCQQAGGYIRRGEKAHMVVFWKWIEQENEETGEKKQIPFLRYYSVFHLDQCEGIAARHANPLPQTADTDEAAERIIAAYLQKSGVKLKHVEDDQACYRPADDSVTLPLRAQFAETAEYYSTAFHELTHSTGHKFPDFPLDYFLVQCYNFLGHGLRLLSNVCLATSFYQMTLTLSLVLGTVFNPPVLEFAQLIVPYRKSTTASTVGANKIPRNSFYIPLCMKSSCTYA